MNKKSIIFILIVIVVISIIAVGLIFLLNKTGEEKKEEIDTFKMLYQGVDITPGKEFEANKITEQATISEIASCAFDGTDKIYTYENLEIIVANVEGKATIYSIYFINDVPQTPEEVKLSDSKEKMIQKYGEDYKTGLGNKYTYKKGNVEISFTIENEVITGIEYTLVTTK